MKKQRGLSLIGLILIGGLLVFVVLLGLKVLPLYIEYYAISRNIKELATSQEARSIREIQFGFDNRATVDDITSVQGRDLDINKNGNTFSIAVSYERRVQLFRNVSLLFNFDVSSDG